MLVCLSFPLSVFVFLSLSLSVLQSSSFSSITDSTMSLNIITVTLNMGEYVCVFVCGLLLCLWLPTVETLNVLTVSYVPVGFTSVTCFLSFLFYSFPLSYFLFFFLSSLILFPSLSHVLFLLIFSGFLLFCLFFLSFFLSILPPILPSFHPLSPSFIFPLMSPPFCPCREV